MEAIEILERVKELGITTTVNGDRLRFEPGSKVTPELLTEIKQHKDELMAHLRRPENIVDAPPEWHAETIAQAVQKEGVCLFWSELFNETIAFIKDETYTSKVKFPVVVYTDKELWELFWEGKPKLSYSDLRRIHEAKKAGGGDIISYRGLMNTDKETEKRIYRDD